MLLFIVMTVLLLAAAGFVYYTNRHGQPKGLIPAALANMGERFSVSTRLRQV